jgi:hypothetical protein
LYVLLSLYEFAPILTCFYSPVRFPNRIQAQFDGTDWCRGEQTHKQES